MRTRLGMGTFFENPMFFFMDEVEPILPTFRSSTDYNDSGRIVELADVGCDTETTIPIRFRRGAFDWRRGEAENTGLTCQTAKWRNERSRNLTRSPASLNNNTVNNCDRKRLWDRTDSTPETSFDRLHRRSKNYVAGKIQRNERNYDDPYIGNLDYDDDDDDTYAEDSCDNFKLPTNDFSEYTSDCCSRFMRYQNMMGRSRKERDVRYDYSKDLKPPFSRNTRAYYKQNAPSGWLADNNERNFYEAQNTNARSFSREHRKHINISPKMNKDFHRTFEFGKLRSMKSYQEEDIPLNASSSAEISRNGFWEFIPFENETNSEGLMLPEHADIADSGKEDKSGEDRKRSTSENLLSEIENGKRPTLKRNMDKAEKSKILQSNLSNMDSPYNQSTKLSHDDKLSKTRSVEKESTNSRSHLIVKEKKNASLILAERKGKNANTHFPRKNINHQNHDRFINKLSNKSLDETSPYVSTKTNKKHNVNPRSENPEDSNTDRINVSQSVAQKIIRDNHKKDNILKMTETFSWTEVEKKKFSSKLPIRTWERLRTKEPAALHVKRSMTNENINQELKKVGLETMYQNDHLVIPKSNKTRMGIIEDYSKTHTHTKNLKTIKQSDRSGTEFLNNDKPKLASTNVRKIKDFKAAGKREMRNLTSGKTAKYPRIKRDVI